MTHQRPGVLTTAIAICVVNSLANVAAIGSPIPRPVAYASLLIALVGLIGAIGLWRLMRWGAPLSAGVLAVTALLAAPGIVVGTIVMLHVVATGTVIMDVGGLVLIFLPASRRAYAFRPPTTPARSTR
jgi:hypothetical protein